MPRVTLIRHAISKFNEGIPCSSYTNVELSERGINMAKTISGEYDLIILSPLKRAIQTYAYSKMETKNITINFLFRELNDRDDGLNLLDYEKPFIETEFDKYARVQEAIAYLKDLQEENVAVVTHHGTIQGIVQVLTGERISIGNGQQVILNL